MMESEEFESLRPKTARNISSHAQCTYESTRGRVVPENQSDAVEELMQHVDAIQKLGLTLRSKDKTERSDRSRVRNIKTGNVNLHEESKASKMNTCTFLSDVEHEKRRAQEFEAKYRELAKMARSEIHRLEQANMKYKNDARMSQDIISDKENEICVVRKELKHAESLSENLSSKLKETESALEKALHDKEVMQKALPSSRGTLNGSGGSPREVNRLQKQLECVQARLKNVQQELIDTKESCRNNHWQLHTDSKHDIPELSDRNRPTKLAERYSELYDNQWTDAFETLDKVYGDEKETIGRLISILLETSAFCMMQSQRQLARIKSAVIASDDKDLSLPVLVSKQLKECRKAVADTAGKNMIQEYICQLRLSTSRTARDALRVKEFLEECFYVCWLMSIQDPPVVLDEEFQSGGRFDSEVYKAYTKSGPTNDYLVWPAMFLHKGGPVLCKGVAQAWIKTHPTPDPKPELSRRKTEKSSTHQLPTPVTPRQSFARSSSKLPDSGKSKRFFSGPENENNSRVRNGSNVFTFGR